MTELQEKLVTENMNLIYSTVHKFTMHYQTPVSIKEELISCATLGLVKAAKRFNPKYGTAFSTYAVITMNSHMFRYIRANKNTNHLELKQATDVSEDSIKETLDTDEKNSVLYKVLNQLPEKEKIIIYHYYGLQNYEQLDQHALAAKLKTNQTNISRTIKRIYSKLKEHNELKELYYVN